MPDPETQTESTPWESLGFSSFDEYDKARTSEITKLSEAAAEVTKKLEEQNAKVNELLEAGKNKGAPDGNEVKKITEDDWEKKAAIAYSNLSADEQATAEEAFKQLPEDVQELIATSNEAKYLMLKEMKPGESSNSDGSVFGNLKPKVPKKTTAELIAESMAALKGAVNPEKKGSGFTIKKPEVYQTASTFMPKPGILNGLYGR